MAAPAAAEPGRPAAAAGLRSDPDRPHRPAIQRPGSAGSGRPGRGILGLHTRLLAAPTGGAGRSPSAETMAAAPVLGLSAAGPGTGGPAVVAARPRLSTHRLVSPPGAGGTVGQPATPPAPRPDPAGHDPARFCRVGGRGTAAPGGLRLWLLMDIPAPCRAELALSLPFGPEFLGRLLGQGLDGAGAALLLGLASPASPARRD